MTTETVRLLSRAALAAVAGVCLQAAPSAGAQEPTPGQIIDKVTCRSDGSQSYALYLPSSYSPVRKWPILYALDPAARGRMPVERFRDAAEQYGYIVAGSNNSRNGPPEPIAAAVRAMMKDTRGRFSIDDRRIYLTGFSGGSRVAAGAAYGFGGLVAGVIGCGAGFPEQIQPSSAVPFVYFGAVGREDLNYVEMRRLDRALDGFGIPHRLAVFEGGHEWPPAAVCLSAIEWMELQSMRAGTREKRDAFIDALLQKDAGAAAADEASGKIYDAYLAYEALVRDFKELRDVSAYSRAADRLKGSKEVRRAPAIEKDEAERQRRSMVRLVTLRDSFAGADDPAAIFRELDQAISDLNRVASLKQPSEDRTIARRTRGQFLVQLRQDASSDLEAKRYSRAEFNLTLATLITPDSPRAFYSLACAYALDGKKGDALGALRSALKKGFNDLEALETNPDLEAVRGDPAFQKMVESLRKK